jgi:hypothetical protein
VISELGFLLAGQRLIDRLCGEQPETTVFDQASSTSGIRFSDASGEHVFHPSSPTAPQRVTRSTEIAIIGRTSRR